MSIVHIGHIQKALEERFVSHIDTSDMRTPSNNDARRLAVFSRALAAFAVSILSGEAELESSAAVVDGHDDNGIDAIYYDPAEPCLHIIQSKWTQDGSAGIALGDIIKFLSGAKDLIAGHFDRFNERTKAKKEVILKALGATNCKCRLTLVHTSIHELSIHATRAIDDFLNEINDASEVVFFRVLGQRELHTAAARSFDNGPIEMEVILSDWGHVEQPYKAYYGQVDADQIAAWWAAHGNRLFDKNLRNLLADSAINNAMLQSLRLEKSHFWYFNNGITIICSDVAKKLAGGSSRHAGVFVCRGASIVNGAQTVGTIGRAKQSGFESLEHAQVMVRLISLESCPPDFVARLTRAANTQNRIQQHDFAALDPEQERIAIELQFDRIKYAYKTGDSVTDLETGFGLEEATVALACDAKDSKLAMYSKGFVGKLWENINSEPYTTLFNTTVLGRDVWKKVKVLRRVEAVLATEKSGERTTRREIAVHGNRFILRQAFRYLRMRKLDSDLVNVSTIARSIVDRIESGIGKVLKDAHLAWTFKTHSKYIKLEKELFADFNEEAGTSDAHPQRNALANINIEPQMKFCPLCQRLVRQLFLEIYVPMGVEWIDDRAQAFPSSSSRKLT